MTPIFVDTFVHKGEREVILEFQDIPYEYSEDT